jgi:hypothetical protein
MRGNPFKNLFLTSKNTIMKHVILALSLMVLAFSCKKEMKEGMLDKENGKEKGKNASDNGNNNTGISIPAPTLLQAMR